MAGNLVNAAVKLIADGYSSLSGRCHIHGIQPHAVPCNYAAAFQIPDYLAGNESILDEKVIDSCCRLEPPFGAIH